MKMRAEYLDAIVENIRMSKVSFSKGEKNIIKCNGGTMFANDYAKTGGAVCYHAAGFIAGVTGAITGKKFVVREIKCVSARDANCEFVIEEKEPIKFNLMEDLPTKKLKEALKILDSK